MTEYLTEQEQIEILKNWVKQYTLVILAGVVLAAIGISGWRYWQQREYKINTHASAIYDEMLLMRSQNNASATLTQAQKLFQHYSKTVYGQMAALMLARDAASQKNFKTAEIHFNWVLDHSRIASLRQIARLRLARLFISEKRPEDGLKILNKIDDQSFNGLIDEVKGDAYLAMKNASLARQSYELALKEIPNAEVVRPLLQMKFDNLSTTV